MATQTLADGTVALNLNGQTQVLAVDGVTTGIEGVSAGYITVSTADGESTTTPFHSVAGVIVRGTLAGSASFAAVKDTASKINIYVESGAIKIQNKLATAQTITVKVIA